MKVSAEYAEQHLAHLLLIASEGEEIEIASANRPSVKLVRTATRASTPLSGRRTLGTGRGELRVPSDEEWAAMDREMEQQMNHMDLLPPREL